MSCVYCAPKSSIRIRWAWISGGRRGSADRRSTDAIIGRFLGDRHVVHVTLAHPGTGDAHELRAGAHLVYVVAARVAHRRAQPPRELVQDRDDTALVRHAALDAFGHQLFELRGRVLEIAVARPLRLGHRAQRSHSAIGLVGSALIAVSYTHLRAHETPE